MSRITEKLALIPILLVRIEDEEEGWVFEEFEEA
jgi:hypothetical protein